MTLQIRVSNFFYEDADPGESITESIAGSAESSVASLCEDREDGTLGEGEQCWSTCHGQCPSAVLKPGLVFDFGEISPGHPGCTSHVECIGNYDRILGHAFSKDQLKWAG
jgi:hypothetical protein